MVNNSKILSVIHGKKVVSAQVMKLDALQQNQQVHGVEVKD